MYQMYHKISFFCLTVLSEGGDDISWSITLIYLNWEGSVFPYVVQILPASMSARKKWMGELQPAYLYIYLSGT